jgi:hypothetical protein
LLPSPSDDGSVDKFKLNNAGLISTSGAREQVLKEENARLRQELGAQRESQQRQPQQQAAAPHNSGTSSSSPACNNAMRTYDNQATTRLNSNLIDMELARTAAEEACGKRVPKMREQIVAEDAEEERRLRAAVSAFCTTNRDDQRCRP